MKKKWLTPSDFELEFAIPIGTQAKKRSVGKLPYSKFGGFIFYNRSKINQLLEEHDMSS